MMIQIVFYTRGIGEKWIFLIKKLYIQKVALEALNRSMKQMYEKEVCNNTMKRTKIPFRASHMLQYRIR